MTVEGFGAGSVAVCALVAISALVAAAVQYGALALIPVQGAHFAAWRAYRR